MLVTITSGVSGTTPPVPSRQTVLTVTSVLEHDIAVAGTTPNQLFTTAWVAANAQAIYIESDIDLTIKTNSSGSPAQTITIKASTPFLWIKNSGVTNPFATDVTALYQSPAGAVAGTLKLRVLI